jgi:3-oxoacyl-[acyl-carrier-protein] synthase III
MRQTKPIRIVAMGKYLPKAVPSEEIERKHGLPIGWAQKYSGVENRHVITHENNGIMGARAAEEALEKASMSLKDIDLLLCGSGTFDYPIPNQSSIIKAEMKDGEKYDTPAIDVNSTCLSFVSALDFAAKILDGVNYKNILIVSSEVASIGLNPSNWETLTLFGDGAAAMIVRYDEHSESRFIKGGQKTYTEGVYHTIIEGGGIRKHVKNNPYNVDMYSFKMNGRHLLKLGRKKMPEFIDWFFDDIPYDVESTDAIIPHQASKIGMSVFTSQYTLRPGQMKETLAKYGNCISASIPLTFMDAVEKGEIKRGDLCFLIGTSAGFSIGAILLKY